jgi:hypothetical protein
VQTFVDLRADYPLFLTLLEPGYPRALTWSCIARRTSLRAIPIALIRYNEPVPVRIYISFRPNSCLPACPPSASQCTWPLTPAHASLREFQLHTDEQLISPVEIAAQISAAALSSIPRPCFLASQIGGICGRRSHMLLRGHRKPNSTEGSYFASAGTRWRAWSRTIWASQIK